MELKIIIKNWRIVTKDDKSKTIGGKYSVMCGATEVAESDFNDGYNNTHINIPTELMLKVEELDKEIKETVIKHFTE